MTSNAPDLIYMSGTTPILAADPDCPLRVVADKRKRNILARAYRLRKSVLAARFSNRNVSLDKVR